jgi:coatomer subunit beta
MKGTCTIFLKESSGDFSTSKLNKVTQLTGFSDPVYAEAYVHVNQV